LVLRAQDVKICLSLEYQPGQNHGDSPDVIVMAAGSEPVVPEIDGLREISVVLAEDVLDNVETLGSTVAVIGGGDVGCEIGEFLALAGKRVVILEFLNDVAQNMEMRTKKLLLGRLSDLNIDIIKNAKVTAVENNKILFTRGGVPNQLHGIDTVVVAAGYNLKGMKTIPPGADDDISSAGMSGPKDALEAIHMGFHLGSRF